ncbi:BTAD domain-containing putative transcriptional regulator [Streptomyces sp. R39]|uniref:BTAD domain-containing putative transcriptional regulator n=1 Tax=Streptomyces sp. R39 TaxID=3238631 RepID=A0AB39QWP2_9ACTN
MRFRLLGPLHVLRNDTPIPLGGISRRATLGYLLLHTNDVISTGRLLHALWGVEAPPTARKILQNAVSGLRRALAEGLGAEGSQLLVTHAPGYVLRADPAVVDLCEFRELARRGQTALALGRWDEADHQLRRALALWNGPALADLAEGGYDWPELTALQNDRFTVLEDRMEAALAAGHHLGVLSELEAVVSAEPLRERLCGQLMTALYRSGRQAEALGAYRRTRAALVEELGLDPGPELQELERAILDHDPALLPTGGAAVRLTASPAPPHAPGPRTPSPPKAAAPSPALVRRTAAGRRETEPSRRRTAAAAAFAPPAAPVGGEEQKQVTAVFVRAEIPAGTTTPEVVEQLLAQARTVVRNRAVRAGGCGQGELGPLTVCVFGADRVREDDALRAVRTAVELAGHTGAGFRLRVAVASGEALVTGATGDPLTSAAAGQALVSGASGQARVTGASAEARVAGAPAEARVAGASGRTPMSGAGTAGSPFGVTGQLFQTGLDMLFEAPPGAVRVCETTRRLCGDRFGFEVSRTTAGGHDVTMSAPAAPATRGEPPFVGRDRELEQLAWWAEEVRRSGRPHLVTVLGEPGIGKSRLMAEFRRRLAAGGGPRCLVGTNRALRPEEPYVSLAEPVRAYAGVADADPELSRDRRLRDAVTELVGPGPVAAQLSDGLRRLISRPGGSACRPLPSAEDDSMLVAWRRFVAELAAREPLVVVLEDFERVDDALLAFAVELAEAVADVPLLVVVTGRLELADRPAYRSGGRRNATTVTLEPLPRPAVDALLEEVLPAPRDSRTTELHATLAERSGGNPLFALEFARAVTGDGEVPGAARAGTFGGRVPVPPAVHAIVSARLDTLGEAEKALLYDASLFEGSFLDRELAALGDTDEHGVRDGLDALERRGLVRRCRRCPELGAVEYQFVHDLIAETAYARLPHAVRADKHLRAAGWLAREPDRSPALVLHHCRRAVHHATVARRPDGDVSGRVGALLLDAGQRARERGATGAAEYYYRVAQEFAPSGRPQWLLPLRRPHEAKSPA